MSHFKGDRKLGYLPVSNGLYGQPNFDPQRSDFPAVQAILSILPFLFNPLMDTLWLFAAPINTYLNNYGKIRI